MVTAALALGACVKDNGPDCGGSAPVEGTWEYHATQTNPSPGAAIAGTLDIPPVDGCEFTGTLSVDVTPDDGSETYTLAGPIFGVAASGTVVNFDAQFSGSDARTHVAEVFGDSLAGEWLEGSGGAAPRGPFWARRIP